MALRPLSYFWTAFRRTWRSDLSDSFITPLLFLSSLGVGLGSLVGHGHRLASLGGVDYLSFVAPALLAATAMQVALVRSTWEVFGYVSHWNGAYRSMQASPISVHQIVTGQLAWVALRVELASAAYLGVSAAFGAVRSPEAAGVLVVGPLVGVAFAAPTAAYSIGVRHDQPLVLIFRLLMLPLFLFSGTFFPVSQLPQALRYLAYALPLWHGVELSRGLYLGTLGTGAAALHLGYLIGLSSLGVLAARATYTRKLAR